MYVVVSDRYFIVKDKSYSNRYVMEKAYAQLLLDYYKQYAASAAEDSQNKIKSV
jgi:hypothetical protein